MRVLKGTLNCQAKKTIEPGSLITITVLDTTRMDAPAIVLGKIVYTDKTSFPFDFEVQYDDSTVPQCPYGFTVGARIEKDGHLNFINDTAHPILNDDLQIKDKVDVDVILVQRF